MMDKQAILRGLGVTAELMGTPLSTDALEVMANDLIDVAEREGDIAVALVRCRREHKGRLTLAAVIDRLPGRPQGADAAWDTAVRARLWDESISVVLPRAIFTAFPLSIWNHGDKVGARMAFKDAYPAALERHGGAMTVSLGEDAEGHAPCVLEALRNGLDHERKGQSRAAPPDREDRRHRPAGRTSQVVRTRRCGMTDETPRGHRRLRNKPTAAQGVTVVDIGDYRVSRG